MRPMPSSHDEDEQAEAEEQEEEQPVAESDEDEDEDETRRPPSRSPQRFAKPAHGLRSRTGELERSGKPKRVGSGGGACGGASD